MPSWRERLKALDGQPNLIKAAQFLRQRLPGDKQLGDPLSMSGTAVGQRLTEVAAERPSAMREVGLSAFQVWQSVSEAQGRGRGHAEKTVLFTDLVEFSDWALDAGDTQSLDLLRKVGLASEPPIKDCGGTIVKRLGDGLMAVFDDPAAGVEAALTAIEETGKVKVGGYSPQMRAGLHVGTPRKLGGDYFGVDVTTAARVAEAAGPNQLLVSEAAKEKLGGDEVKLRRRLRFKAKGAPRDLKVYAAQSSD
jgi:adenylate cyclase